MVIAGYMGCNAEAAVIMFTISIGFNGMTVPGSKSNMLDFAPKYSGKAISIVYIHQQTGALHKIYWLKWSFSAF